MKLLLRPFLALCLVAGVLGALPSPAAEAAVDQPASEVLGQIDSVSSGRWDTGRANGSVAYSWGLNDVRGTATDTTTNRLYVADANNNRVLVFALDPVTRVPARTAFAVIGQPDFVSRAAGLSATTLDHPWSISIDATRQRLFVVDRYNARVLVYDTSNLSTGMAASYVIGQSIFSTKTTSVSASTFLDVVAVTVDVAGNRLFAVDSSASRVLVFNLASIANGMSASNVLGQTGFGASGQSSLQARLRLPYAAHYEAINSRLWVADNQNHRVVSYNVAAITNGEAAENVLGQAGYGTRTTGSTSAQMNQPEGVVADPAANRLYVSDLANNRVLVFDTTTVNDGEAASYVLGQSTSNGNGAGVSATGLHFPTGLNVDTVSGRVYVSDTANNRVAAWPTSTSSNGASAIDVIGHNFANGSANFDSSAADDSVTSANGFSGPTGTTIDTVGHRLFVADSGNARVLVYNLDSSNRLLDGTADYVLGQSNFSTSAQAVTAEGMITPISLAYEATANLLYVSDSNANRVQVFNVAAITNGEAAAHILGQPNATTGTGDLSATKLNIPYSVTVDDATNRLYVADINNVRVLVFNTGALSTGMSASFVLGQTGFGAAAQAATADGLGLPYDVSIDTTRQRLYVADGLYHRVLVYNTSNLSNGLAAIAVFGQSTLTGSTPGVSQTALTTPRRVFIEPVSQRLFVADTKARVMVFDATVATNGEPAVSVLGQNSFSSSTAGLGQSGMDSSMGLGFEPTLGRLIVSDYSNHRILFFDMTASSASTTVGTYVDPSLTFIVGGHSGSCNGQAQSAGASVSGTAVALGHASTMSNVVGAQDLTVTSNSSGGFIVYARNTGAPNNGNGHSLANVAGNYAAPATFSAAGTEAFGFTTDDADLTQFAGNKWAPMGTSQLAVSQSTTPGPVNADLACVGYQVGVGGTTRAGSYSTTVIYTAVPAF